MRLEAFDNGCYKCVDFGQEAKGISSSIIGLTQFILEGI